MKDKSFLLLLLIATFQLVCAPEQKIKAYNITPFLETKVKLAKSSGEKVKLELCKTTSFKWDKIIVVVPYTTPKMIRSYNLENSKYVERHMLDTLYQETDCLLLFIDGESVVRHCYVPISLVDFTNINQGEDSKIIISKDLACGRLYIKNVNSHISLYSQ